MKKKNVKGGEFLIKETEQNEIFIPEELSEEQLMIAQTCEDFIEKEIRPNLKRIDDLETGLMPSLLLKAGELGLLSISIPKEYGGYDQDFVTSVLSTEKLGAGQSFAVSFAAHTGIGTLPILFYGNPKQKQTYLPKLASGEWKASYCLTEPEAGSDPNSGKTKATLNHDRTHYVISGQKMWITNGSFADILIVFAKIENDKNLSAFIVEKWLEGVQINAEEKKMGIKGSSTVQIFFNNCQVPSENLLGQREGGFEIALNILNVGRIKLAAAALGSSKWIIDKSIKYANERIQFGNPISKYGAIKHKLAEQTIKTFAIESALYRCSQNIEDFITSMIDEGTNKEAAILEGFKQFAIEAAILKISGSETLDYVIDEGVQIYGGMGYSAEAPMESIYRDSRINRIFEGTNEINRMLIVDMLIKKGMQGDLNLTGPTQNVQKELLSIPKFSNNEKSFFEKKRDYIQNFKKIVLMITGKSIQKYMMTLKKEQEILMNIADIIICIYNSESLLLRIEKIQQKKDTKNIKELINILEIYLYDTASHIEKLGKDTINAIASEDEQKMFLLGLKRFTKNKNIDVKEARRNIADKLIKENKYCF